MELQWPLILFTMFAVWSAGVFGVQNVAVLAGDGKRAQMPALVVSAVFLCASLVAMGFHLGHFERIFKVFGNLSSGIAQELAGVVVLAALMVIVSVLLHKASADEVAPVIPKWLAALAILASVVFIFVIGRSYMMAGRPAWDSLLGPLTLLGAGCTVGSLTFAAIEAFRSEMPHFLIGLIAIVGSLVNALLSIAQLITLSSSSAPQATQNYYYDPVQSISGTMNAVAKSSSGGDSTVLMVVVVVTVVVPVVASLIGKKTGNWKMWGSIGALAAVVGIVALRMVFYGAGANALFS